MQVTPSHQPYNRRYCIKGRASSCPNSKSAPNDNGQLKLLQKRNVRIFKWRNPLSVLGSLLFELPSHPDCTQEIWSRFWGSSLQWFQFTRSCESCSQRQKSIEMWNLIPKDNTLWGYVMPSCSDCLEKSDDSIAVKRRDQQIEMQIGELQLVKAGATLK